MISLYVRTFYRLLGKWKAKVISCQVPRIRPWACIKRKRPGESKEKRKELEESKLMVKHVSLNYLSQRREQTIPRMSTLPSAKS
jgi:hypothetical protein